MLSVQGNTAPSILLNFGFDYYLLHNSEKSHHTLSGNQGTNLKIQNIDLYEEKYKLFAHKHLISSNSLGELYC